MGDFKINCNDFSLSETLECGQCFRYYKTDDNSYTIIAKNRVLKLSSDNENIIFHDTNDINYWSEYFDIERDYGEIKNLLITNDDVMKNAVSFAPGIRILKQEFFETLISFIISQNNHIPRIKGLIERLSKEYGTKLTDDYYAFPTPAQLSLVTEEDYRALNFGFRARYLVDAVQKVYSGEIEYEKLNQLPTDEIRKSLMNIVGVGPKVADCILLFAFARYEVFPIDVWINRVVSHAYYNGENLSKKQLLEGVSERFGKNAGFAQQYLFHYGREMKIGKE